jgi:hypothetical protein
MEERNITGEAIPFGENFSEPSFKNRFHNLFSLNITELLNDKIKNCKILS